MNGKRLPRLDSFLAVCMRLGADPLQVAVSPFARAGPASSSSVGRCSSALASDSIRDVTSLSASAAA